MSKDLESWEEETGFKRIFDSILKVCTYPSLTILARGKYSFDLSAVAAMTDCVLQRGMLCLKVSFRVSVV